MSQFEPLATSSPFTCTVFALAGPPGTVSLVCVAWADAKAARLRAPASTTRIPRALEMDRDILLLL
jgi:hypothetical protein